MNWAELLLEQLPHTLSETSLNFGPKYRGKVRDVYSKNNTLLIVTTDRLSAFDHILTTIPFKGELLNQLSLFWFSKTKDVVENHVIDSFDPNVTVAKKTEPIRIEFVVRGYLTGSLFREYEQGIDAYELNLPKEMKRDQKFEKPLITPSIKNPLGTHDENVSTRALLEKNLISKRDLEECCEATLGLFRKGQSECSANNLILVDTKYEFGKIDNKIILIDEIHTPDSSRFWEKAGYDERFKSGQNQVMLDKENIRQWLINERGFSGAGKPPEIPDEQRVELAQKYISAFEKITGSAPKLKVGSAVERLQQNFRNFRNT